MQNAIKPGYLRVTEVLSPFSGLSKIAPLILQNAADRGTLVHKVIEDMQEGFPKEEIPDHVFGYIESYEKWAKGKIFLPKPPRLYCDELMITGEPDDMYLDGDDLVLDDYKTPLRESKTWPMQATAYSYLCKKNGYNVTRIQFVKLDKTGKAPKVFNYLEDMDMFRKILECYRYFFKEENKENDLDYL